MQTPSVRIPCLILGRYSTAVREATVARCLLEGRPVGPAVDAYVYIEKSAPDQWRARYLSWVNLFDVEHASTIEPGAWELAVQVEDEFVADWYPYGWGGELLPNVAYS